MIFSTKPATHFLAASLFVCLFSTSSFAQSFESLLSELNLAMKSSNTKGMSGEALFDKHNCILHLQWQEFTLRHIELRYKYDKDALEPEYPHHVIVECQKFFSNPCAGENTLSFVFVFSDKRSAIGFLNTFNDLIVLARKNGFCQID